jgi:serine/threonine-protein kinase
VVRGAPPHEDFLIRHSAPGATVAGRYEIVRRIGIGAMGTVSEAHDRETGSPVAIKMLRGEHRKDADTVERFRREAMVLMDLRHPSIVQMYDFGILDSGHAYIVLELLAGESMRVHLETKGPFEPQGLLPVLSDVAGALDHAHQSGVVHRDVKPQNIVLLASPAPGGPCAKVVDFGIAKVTWDAPMTAAGVSLGTLRYAAPEQLRGARDADTRADVHSLGVVAFEALAGLGKLPFRDGTDLFAAILAGNTMPLSDRRPGLGDALDAVLAKAIARDREDRYGSPGELFRAYAIAIGA